MQDSHPIEIATSVADRFKNLRNDIEKFSKDFTQYLLDEGKRLTEEVEAFEKDIKKYQAEVDRCVLRWLVLCCSF